MKDSLLLIMTPNMSLEKWNTMGQLSRELALYEGLCKAVGWKLIIFSYGRNDRHYLANYKNFEVLTMPGWIPAKIPFRAQNLIYHLVAPFCFRKFFKRAILSKTNQFDAAPFGLMLKLLFGIPLVIRMGYYHSHFKTISSAKRITEFVCFNNCDKIITTSAEAGGFIAKRYAISKSKILCMPNSINLSVFAPGDVPKVYDIVFVGRLEKVKNIELLLNVIESLNLKALIIGNGSLAPMVSNLTDRCAGVVWEKRVDNVDLPLYYSQAHVFAMLSQYEGNPKALLEAMACGVPCVGTNVPGIRDCIVHNYSGMLAEPYRQSVMSALFELLSSPDKRSLLSNNALKWVHANCDFESNLLKEVSLYESLIKTRLSASLS